MKTYFVCLAGLLIGSAAFGQTSQPAEFARSLDLERLRLIAVQHEGRLKTFDTLARETVQEIAGTSFLPDSDAAAEGNQEDKGEEGGQGCPPPKKATKLDPVYVYLVLLLRGDG
jgi:hypothetical protein